MPSRRPKSSSRRSPVPPRKARRGASKAKRQSGREFSVVIERDADGWYVGSVPELPGCHTQARSLDALLERVKEAIDACLPDIGASSPRSFLGVQRIAV